MMSCSDLFVSGYDLNVGAVGHILSQDTRNAWRSVIVLQVVTKAGQRSREVKMRVYKTLCKAALVGEGLLVIAWMVRRI